MKKVIIILLIITGCQEHNNPKHNNGFIFDGEFYPTNYAMYFHDGDSLSNDFSFIFSNKKMTIVMNKIIFDVSKDSLINLIVITDLTLSNDEWIGMYQLYEEEGIEQGIDYVDIFYQSNLHTIQNYVINAWIEVIEKDQDYFNIEYIITTSSDEVFLGAYQGDIDKY